MWEQFMNCFKNNKTKGCNPVKLTELYKRVPPNQRQQYKAFLRKNEEYKARVQKYPSSLPRIDWKYYEQNVRPEYISWVKDFARKYDKLDTVFENRHTTIDHSHYFEEVGKQTAEVKKEIADYKKCSNKRICKMQEQLNHLKNMKPYEDMTMEEFCILHPNEAPDFINKPTFWPHLPDEQEPGPAGLRIPEGAEGKSGDHFSGSGSPPEGTKTPPTAPAVGGSKPAAPGGPNPPPAGGANPPPAGGTKPPPAGGTKPPPAGGTKPPPAGGTKPPPAGGDKSPPGGGVKPPPAGGTKPPGSGDKKAPTGAPPAAPTPPPAKPPKSPVDNDPNKKTLASSNDGECTFITESAIKSQAKKQSADSTKSGECIRLSKWDKPRPGAETKKGSVKSTADTKEQVKAQVDKVAAQLAVKGKEFGDQLAAKSKVWLKILCAKICEKTKKIEAAAKAAREERARELAEAEAKKKAMPKPDPACATDSASAPAPVPATPATTKKAETVVLPDRTTGSPDICIKTIIRGDEDVKADVKPKHANLGIEEDDGEESPKIEETKYPSKSTQKQTTAAFNAKAEDVDTTCAMGEEKILEPKDREDDEDTKCALEPNEVPEMEAKQTEKCDSTLGEDQLLSAHAKMRAEVEKLIQDCKDIKAKEEQCAVGKLKPEDEEQSCKTQAKHEDEGADDEVCSERNEETVSLKTSEPVFVCTEDDSKNEKSTPPKTKMSLAETPTKSNEPTTMQNQPLIADPTVECADSTNTVMGSIEITEETDELSSSSSQPPADVTKPEGSIPSSPPKDAADKDSDSVKDTTKKTGDSEECEPVYACTDQTHQMCSEMERKAGTTKSEPVTKVIQSPGLALLEKPTIEAGKQVLDVSELHTKMPRQPLVSDKPRENLEPEQNIGILKRTLTESQKSEKSVVAQEKQMTQSKDEPKATESSDFSFSDPHRKLEESAEDMANKIALMATESANYLSMAKQTVATAMSDKEAKQYENLETAYIAAQKQANRAIAEAYKAMAAAKKLNRRARRTHDEKDIHALQMAEKHVHLAKLLARRAIQLKNEIAKMLSDLKNE